MSRSMRKLGEVHDDCNRSGAPCAYWGERQGWYVVAGRSRDSDSLEESNFRSILRDLGGEGDYVAVERESHWAVGWVENLLLSPGNKLLLRKAVAYRKGLEDYPVYDENDWNELEYENFWTFAKSELLSYDGWEDALHHMMEVYNTFIGEEGSEWECIERTKEELEARDAGEENCLPVKPSVVESLTGNLFGGI